MSNMMEKRTNQLWILAVDLGLIFLAYACAFLIGFGGFPEYNWHSFLALLPWILLTGLLFFTVYELHQLRRKSEWDIVRSTLVAVTLMTVVTMAASFLLREPGLPRQVVAISSVLIIFFLIGWKVIYIRFMRRWQEDQVLLVSDSEHAPKLIAQLKQDMFQHTKVRHVQPNTDVSRLYRLVDQSDDVLVSSDIEKETKSKLIYHAMKNKKSVYVIPSLYELLLSHAQITSVGDSMVMAVRPFGLSPDQQLIKRLFDGATSAVLLLLLSPLLAFVALLIKLEDPKGSVLFKQQRIGKNNRPFTIYKFRSMIEGAEAHTGPVLASENDSRITRVGRFIRATRLDELPQLLNVLKGEMSLVGPRPEREYFTKQLSKQLESYTYRSSVQPGITGYAQVMGKYSTSAEDKLRYDLYYIRNYSFWLDIVIMLRTCIVLLDRNKAEGQQGSGGKQAASAKTKAQGSDKTARNGLFRRGWRKQKSSNKSVGM